MADPARPWRAQYPPGTDVSPIVPSTLPALLDRACAAYAARPAIDFPGWRLTYATLGAEVERVARGLAALGIGPGETVALLLPNAPIHPITFFAIARTGARAVHLTPLDPARAVLRKLADSGARTLVTLDHPAVLPQALTAWREGGCARLVVAGATGRGAVPEGALDWAALDGPARAWPTVAPADVALLQYTGGTTGQPRAAMLSHQNLTSAVEIYRRWNAALGRDLVAGDRVMCVLPLFHIYALTSVMLRAIEGGAELLLRPRFDAEAALDDIERMRCTHFAGVPTMWIALVNHPRTAAADLSSLKACSSGGAALPAETSARFEALTGIRLGGGWGMTETSPAGTNLMPASARIPGEIGVPLPGIDMDVVSLDDPSLVLPPGTIGELRIRGPNVTPGYWDRAAENASAFVDGWFLTGDIGHMTADGTFAIVDRKKDMLISGGFNVYPRTIEDAIHEHPDVREAAVIGVPDPYRGQAAKAYVALREGAAPFSLEALRAFLADKLGRHELPAALEFRAELPHTPVGKLAKRVLSAEINEA